MERKIAKIVQKIHPARISELALYLLKDEAISGKLIIGATLLALVAANTALAGRYESLWHTNLHIGLGSWAIDKDLRHWVDEALMAIFFLVVGLELKREMVQGDLRRFRTAVLPFAAALGGMVVPAIIYLSFNLRSEAINGWAIPMATDIAFAIGILAIVGKAIPASVRLFLLTLAIVDDVGAVIVIALFYNQGINLWALGLAVLLSALLFGAAKTHKLNMSIYVLGCVGLWLAVNASGVHASIAGILMGLFAPLAVYESKRQSIAARVEHAMIPVSTFIVVPLFAFANTGVVLSLSSFQDKTAVPIAAGIIAGLVIGKVTGILGASWLMIRLNRADLPQGATWRHMVGVGLLAGIGFTVSIFVTELAFKQAQFITVAKLSIFVASATCGLLGLWVLKRNSRTSLR